MGEDYGDAVEPEYLGAVVDLGEPYRFDALNDVIMRADTLEKCYVVDDAEMHEPGAFDIVEVDEFGEYWEESRADEIFIGGNINEVFEVLDGNGVDPGVVNFDEGSVPENVESPSKSDILKEQLSRLVPGRSYKVDVDLTTSRDVLEEAGYGESDIMTLGEFARSQR
ncbi:MAG: hypothetical protein ABEJ36_06125 [Candidatus Nanosalina sp.]